MSKINNYNSKLHIAKANKNLRDKDLHLLGDEHHDLQVGGELHGGQPALHRPHLLHHGGAAAQLHLRILFAQLQKRRKIFIG